MSSRQNTMGTRWPLRLRPFRPGWLWGAAVAVLLSLWTAAGSTAAQDASPQPTPLVITLPAATAAATATPAGTTAPGAPLPPDRFEPNDDATAATVIGLQTERDLTLSGADVDAFTGYLKAGQTIRVRVTAHGALDPRLTLLWDGRAVAANDDRSATELGAALDFTAPAAGWYVAIVEKASVYDGSYDLETAWVAPTATATAATVTPQPTLTPTPTATPLTPPDAAEPNDGPADAWPITPGQEGAYSLGRGDVDIFTFLAKAGNRYACETVSDAVDTLLTVTGAAGVIGLNDDRSPDRVDSYLAWTTVTEQPVQIQVTARGGGFGPYSLSCRHAVPPPPPGNDWPPAADEPGGESAAATAAAATGTAPLEASPDADNTADRLPLTVQHLGPAPSQPLAPATTIRLLVYYDANNDRQPGPGEGIANVSVLAVDAQGQQLARVFTNLQGEAVFHLSDEAVARVIVPFVPGWQAAVRAGAANNDIVLGLPAVRLPVFLPVQNSESPE